MRTRRGAPGAAPARGPRPRPPATRPGRRTRFDSSFYLAVCLLLVSLVIIIVVVVVVIIVVVVVVAVFVLGLAEGHHDVTRGDRRSEEGQAWQVVKSSKSSRTQTVL